MSDTMKSWVERQLRNFLNLVLAGKFLDKNEHSEIQRNTVATFVRKNGSCTITQKENNIVNVQNNTDDNEGTIFSVPVDPTKNNIISFNFSNIVSESDTPIAIRLFCDVTSTFAAVGNFSILGTDNQSYKMLITPDTIARLGQTTTLKLVPMIKQQGLSYDIGITNTIGENLSVERVIQQGLDNIEGKKLKGKKFLFLGDSITSFMNTQDSWVDKFIAISGGIKVANVAVQAATLKEYNDTVHNGNPTSTTPHNNTLGNQVQKVINEGYEAPDVIVIAIGTNGGITADDTRLSATYKVDDALPSLDDLDTTHTEGAFRWANEKLHNLYPNAMICWCNPIQRATMNDEIYSYAEALRKLTSYGGVINIETNRCGIVASNEYQNAVGECLKDGLHPNDKGAMKMARYNAVAISNLF